jgi:hypothetical protein
MMMADDGETVDTANDDSNANEGNGESIAGSHGFRHRIVIVWWRHVCGLLSTVLN